jgi:hypothetical protein
MFPKQAKKRDPNELVLATFRIPYEKWEKFQQAASAAGTTASATLLAFIEGYLAEAETGSKATTPNSPESQEQSDWVQPNSSNPDSELEPSAVSEFHPQSTADIKQQVEAIVQLKMTEFEPTIHGIQTQVNALSKRLEQVEDQVGKLSQGKTGKGSEFIDVQAVSVDSDLNQDHLNHDEALNDDYDPENLGGLSQLGLCMEFGINPNNLNRHAIRRGLSTAEYLHQLTGWIYRNGKYYPPES